ncbi:hypothetical protein Scep_019521 [Stephania cephalantha]|uniref:Uncharacterized protein n=1 Tax=Stephania cephalantha TaxID=152367 RepID=A0AAP0IB70_9MAGN
MIMHLKVTSDDEEEVNGVEDLLEDMNVDFLKMQMPHLLKHSRVKLSASHNSENLQLIMRLMKNQKV